MVNTTMKKYKIAIAGTGYVGVSNAMLLAQHNDVIAVDIVPEKVAMLNNKQSPIEDVEIEDFLQNKALSFTATLDNQAAYQHADFVIIATPTDYDPQTNYFNTQSVEAVIRDVLAINPNAVMVIKSTVPVGTNRQVKQVVSKANPKAEFDVASNPEFLREGAAIDDFMRPDRVVVGVQNERAAEVMNEIYRPLYLREFPIMATDLESAEMIKYAANAFLATKITFINEIAALCEKTGADVKMVSKGMGLDGRIGDKFLHAGPGYGGSCFPKDTQALARMGQDHSTPMQLTETVIKVNDQVKRRMIDKIVDLCGGSVNGKVITVLGVTFKPNTDDMRDSPSLTIVPWLVGNGAKVRVVDPQGKREGEGLLPGVAWNEDVYKATQNADAVVILTEWNEFRALDLKRMAKRMTTPVMADLRNIYTPKDVKQAGFTAYVSIGREGFGV